MERSFFIFFWSSKDMSALVSTTSALAKRHKDAYKLWQITPDNVEHTVYNLDTWYTKRREICYYLNVEDLELNNSITLKSQFKEVWLKIDNSWAMWFLNEKPKEGENNEKYEYKKFY